MDNPRTPLLNWPYYYQGKSMEELRQSLFYTTLELESTRLAAQEEITKREEQILHLQQLLNKAIKQRDEAQSQHNIILEDVLKKDGFSTLSSDCEESVISSPPPPTQIISENALLEMFSPKKPLPEKGKFLQAMMNAGPLLQTLLLAGPLPQWRHPPPPLDTFEIPPVYIPGCGDDIIRVNGSNCGAVSNRKRGFDNALIAGPAGYDTNANNKYQRVLFH